MVLQYQFYLTDHIAPGQYVLIDELLHEISMCECGHGEQYHSCLQHTNSVNCGVDYLSFFEILGDAHYGGPVPLASELYALVPDDLNKTGPFLERRPWQT